MSSLKKTRAPVARYSYGCLGWVAKYSFEDFVKAPQDESCVKAKVGRLGFDILTLEQKSSDEARLTQPGFQLAELRYKNITWLLTNPYT